MDSTKNLHKRRAKSENDKNEQNNCNETLETRVKSEGISNCQVEQIFFEDKARIKSFFGKRKSKINSKIAKRSQDQFSSDSEGSFGFVADMWLLRVLLEVFVHRFWNLNLKNF